MYTITDRSGKQYNSRQGYYICSKEALPFFYNSHELHEYVYEVILDKEEPYEKLPYSYYVEKIQLGKRYSLLLPETYTELGITPSTKLREKALLAALYTENINVLEEWWRYVRADKKFFDNYLKMACLSCKFKVLQFWAETGRKHSFFLHLWDVAEKFNSSLLCDWFFRYGIENNQKAYCRLSIAHALKRDRTLLYVWQNWLMRNIPEENRTEDVSRALQKGVIHLFEGSYEKCEENIIALSREGSKNDLDDLFFRKACFPIHYKALDEASENGNLETLNFWLDKAINYGPSFLPYKEALDLAAFRGHISVLEFWSFACSLFSLPLQHSEELIKYALLQGRVDILRWWRKYSNKHFSSSLITLAIRKDNLEVIKFLITLENRKEWINFGPRLLSSCSESTKEWWVQKGEKEFMY